MDRAGKVRIARRARTSTIRSSVNIANLHWFSHLGGMYNQQRISLSFTPPLVFDSLFCRHFAPPPPPGGERTAGGGKFLAGPNPPPGGGGGGLSFPPPPCFRLTSKQGGGKAQRYPLIFWDPRPGRAWENFWISRFPTLKPQSNPGSVL